MWRREAPQEKDDRTFDIYLASLKVACLLCISVFPTPPTKYLMTKNKSIHYDIYFLWLKHHAELKSWYITLFQSQNGKLVATLGMTTMYDATTFFRFSKRLVSNALSALWFSTLLQSNRFSILALFFSFLFFYRKVKNWYRHVINFLKFRGNLWVLLF